MFKYIFYLPTCFFSVKTMIILSPFFYMGIRHFNWWVGKFRKMSVVGAKTDSFACALEAAHFEASKKDHQTVQFWPNSLLLFAITVRGLHDEFVYVFYIGEKFRQAFFGEGKLCMGVARTISVFLPESSSWWLLRKASIVLQPSENLQKFYNIAFKLWLTFVSQVWNFLKYKSSIK